MQIDGTEDLNFQISIGAGRIYVNGLWERGFGEIDMAAGKMRDFVMRRVLHVDLDARREEKETLQGIARDTIGNEFIEEDPSVAEWFRGLIPTQADVGQYVRDLFPSASWGRRYNLHWLLGDAIAGITVGLVVVPQAMAYALLARLTPAYGLYTTFTGAALYWIFGTSKDIVIGTTAVGSLLVGSVISNVEAAKPGVYEPQQIAHTLSVLAGFVLLFLGFFRLGWLIEFIPYIPISAFVTSASITIMSTQIPVCLGITGINTREAPYLVLINTLKGLPRAKLDAAIGITSIILLFLIRDVCAKMEARQPSRKRLWSMLSSLRLTFTVLLYTFISWLVHRNTPASSPKFRIVGKIEKGFSHASIPTMDTELFGLVATELPAIVIILIVEHIAIAKSFGRIYGYTVNPSQEILAQGAANILSPFVGGYVCTGSFGASAVLSKAGVRTPLAGLFSAMVLVLALYALTAVFYYIPNAALAGLIIHATCNLVTPPKSLYNYWQLSPIELGIWIIGVLLAMFTDLEISIYAGIALSFALLLFRMARTPGIFPGTLKVTRILRNNNNTSPPPSPVSPSTSSFSSATETSPPPTPPCTTPTPQTRTIFLPLHPPHPHNPALTISPPHPGIFIYQFASPLNYTNQAQHMDHLLTYITTHTRRTLADDGIAPQDRLWSEIPPAPPKHLHSSSSSSSSSSSDAEIFLPVLRAVVLDFSNVGVIDVTCVQGLVDLRAALDRWAGPGGVEWHFAGVRSRWSRRALAYAGFGMPSLSLGRAGLDGGGMWCPAYTVAASLEGCVAEEKRKMEPLYGVDRPFFHVDLVDAVDAAERNAKRRDEVGDCRGNGVV